MYPSSQPLNYWRTALGGMLFTFVFAGTFWGLYALARPVIADMGMALLALGLPMFVIGLVISLATALTISFFILPKELQHYRWYVLGFASLLATGTYLLIEFVRPQTTPLINITFTAIATGIYFVFLSILARSQSQVIVKTILPTFLVTGMVIANVTFRYHGTTKTQVEGLKTAGYGIYIPNPSKRDLPHAQYIRPENGEYDKYDDSIEITLTDLSANNTFNKLYESKYDGPIPGSDCVSVDDLPVYDEAVNETFSNLCTLVSQNNSISVYRKELVSSKSGFAGGKEYFAYAGKTKITTSYDGDGNDIEVGRQILENLLLLEEKNYANMVVKY
jgi:hypothetical protein